MAKKALIAIAIIALLVVLGTGILIGSQFAGTPAEAGDQSSTDPENSGGGGEDGSTATATANESSTATETPGENTTATQTEVDIEDRESIPSREFNEKNVSAHIRQFLNEERQAAGVPPFETGVKTEDDLNAMAQGHSEQMAIEGKAIHRIDGVSSKNRYENSGLYDRCIFNSAEGSYFETPDNTRFEAVEHTVAGQVYEDDGEKQFNANDGDVARAIVDEWMDWENYRERLLLENANIVGIGVEITDTGNVYATANICG